MFQSLLMLLKSSDSINTGSSFTRIPNSDESGKDLKAENVKCKSNSLS